MKINSFTNYKLHDQIVEKVHGWSPADQLLALFNTAISTNLIKNADILEVGTWCGRSSISLAFAAKNISCKVHAIDLFPGKNDWYINDDGNASFQTKVNKKQISGYTDQRVWPDAFEYLIDGYKFHKNNDLEKIFKNNLKTFKIDQYVLPFKGTLKEFLKINKNKYRMIFLDGDHSFKGVSEEIKLVKKSK